MSERRKFTDYEKKTIYAKYNGRCAICGRPVDFVRMTVDHKIPLSKNGTNSMDNLQLACKSCNLMKSDFTMNGFMEQISEILKYNKWLRIKSVFVKEGDNVI